MTEEMGIALEQCLYEFHEKPARGCRLRLFRVSLRELHQLFWHPLTDSFFCRLFDAASAIVPVVSVALRPALAFVVFGLFKAENDSIRDFVPILKLDAASYDRQTCGPVFFRSTIVLLGDG